jgi:penicillin amidase
MSELTDLLRARARDALPPVDGELKVPGLREPVEVRRDRWGVPHIYARNLHDLYFAQGYVTASERLFQIEFSYRTGSGRLSELVGEAALPLDRFIRTLGWNRAARRQVAAWDDLSMDIARAAAAGTRAWIDHMPAQPVEYDILQSEPLRLDEEDAIVAAACGGLFMAWTLSANWDAELLRAQLADALGWELMTELFPATPTVPTVMVAGKDGGPASRRHAFELLRQAPKFPSGQGSNNWVVSGRRTKTGMPLLANDPHVFAQVPSVWFEVHLVAPGVNVRGVALPFATAVLLGHNERIAWGCTNVGGDTQDLYREQLNAEGTAALYDGAWEPLTIHREEIPVRGRAEPEVLEVKETRHGPILDSYLVGMSEINAVEGRIEQTYALQWVGFEHSVSVGTVHRLNTAGNFDEFRAALADWSCPGQNFVYADVDGNIGYQATGWHPIRRRGDGAVPAPGWSPEFGWDGWVPFEEMPWSYNPEQGFLCTANQKIHDDSYPYLLGQDFLPPFRSRRIAQMITEVERHDADSFARMQSDWLSLPARGLVPLLLELEPADDRQKQALGVLREWDCRLAPDSSGAAIYQVWCIRLSEAILLPRLGRELYEHFYSKRQWSNEFQTMVLPRLLEFPSAAWFGREGSEARDDALRASLDEALDELTRRLGEDMTAWSWGAIHPIRYVGRIGAAVPDLAELFTAGEAPWGGDEMTVNQGTFEPGADEYATAVVASWREIIDLSDLDASRGTHTVGQSGNPASPHWNDLFPLWSTGRHHPLPFSRPAVEAATESVLQLEPEG